MPHLTKYEQEAIIDFNEGEATASVYIYNQALQRKLKQLARETGKSKCIFGKAKKANGFSESKAKQKKQVLDLLTFGKRREMGL